MGVPDGSAPAAMPTADVETAAALRLETVLKTAKCLRLSLAPSRSFCAGRARRAG